MLAGRFKGPGSPADLSHVEVSCDRPPAGRAGRRGLSRLRAKGWDGLVLESGSMLVVFGN